MAYNFHSIMFTEKISIENNLKLDLALLLWQYVFLFIERGLQFLCFAFVNNYDMFGIFVSSNFISFWLICVTLKLTKRLTSLFWNERFLNFLLKFQILVLMTIKEKFKPRRFGGVLGLIKFSL